ncbi:MAG: tripartite tricarboxylate transporter TctB family protein [Deltaproteobacteria bacterium]|nr:tripartite tricarboxylate transporter TctB family protein [Deltaproteobacteria bacterium]
MKLKGSFWVALFFLALGLFGIIQSLTFRYWESMVLPLGISIIIFILAAVQVVRELRRRGEAAAAKATAEDSGAKAETRRLGLIFGWAAGFCLAIYLFGFYIAIPTFAFAYLKWRRRGWLVAVIFAVGLLVFSYAVFAIGLKVPLYKGLIFGAH